MPTRLYLLDTTSGGTPSVSPAYDSWNDTGGAVRRRLSTVREVDSAFESRARAEAVATSPYDVLLVQFVSSAIAAQTISGSLKGQIRASESNADADFRAQLMAKVVSNDGTTLRGTLLARDASALSSEFATALTNRKFPLAAISPATLSSVVAQAGDRIVVEIGYRSHNTHTTSRTGTIDVGCASATDLLEDETTTTQNNPWLEFSADIAFQQIERRLTHEVAEIAGSRVPERRVTQELAEIAGSKNPERRVSQIVVEVAMAVEAGGWGIFMDEQFE